MRDPLRIIYHLSKHYKMTTKSLQDVLELKPRTFYNLMKGTGDRLPIQSYRKLLALVDDLSQRPTSPDISLFLPEQLALPFVVDRQSKFDAKLGWTALATAPSWNPVDYVWQVGDLNTISLSKLLTLPSDEKPLNQRLYMKENGIWRRV